MPAPVDPIPGLGPDVAGQISQRLLGLGLADVALEWALLHGIDGGEGLAQIHLARRDGRAALQALERQSAPNTEDLRAKAYAILGDHQMAAATLQPVERDAALKELALAQDWQALSQQPTSEWAKLSRLLGDNVSPPADGVDTFGPLARGLALTEQSAATRAEIEKLLNAVPMPE